MEKRHAIPVRLGKEMVQLTLLKDPNSFTGYSFISLGTPDEVGIPASIFNVAIFNTCIRLSLENERLRKMLEARKEKA
jgi:hypothetical protein